MEKDYTAAPQTGILQIDTISKSFGYRRILNGVDLSLQEGEMTLLLGKNGSGKTTLMKIIAGLIQPSSGRIFFKEGDITKDPEKLRRAIGVITHHIGFYGELTAAENLIFFGKLEKTDGLADKVVQSLSKTGLTPFSNLPVKTFSSGMGKRLNIARLMVLAPEILLLDEPYTGLDYDSTRFFNEYLTDFKASGGAALMITHQIETCFGLCDRIAILEHQEVRRCFLSAEHSIDEIIQLYHNLTR